MSRATPPRSWRALWLEHRDDISRAPRVPRSGDNAGLEPEHSAPGCSMPVRHVYGSGVVVRRVAGAVHASAGGGLAWQARCHVLGRDHGGSALVVGGVGFCNPRSSRSLFKTQGPIPANRAQWASSGGIRPPDGPLAEAREGILRLSQRDLAITLRSGTRGAKMGKSRAPGPCNQGPNGAAYWSLVAQAPGQKGAFVPDSSEPRRVDTKPLTTDTPLTPVQKNKLLLAGRVASSGWRTVSRTSGRRPST